MSYLLRNQLFNFLLSDMAEAAMISSLGVLIKELAPELKEEVCLICRVDEELENLSSMLSIIQSMLTDAEERQITDQAVKEWLAQLQNVAYDANDVLDEFTYEALRQKSMEPDETKKKVCNFFLSCCRLRPIRFRRSMAHRIKKINKRVDRISRDGERFRLKKGDGEIRRIPNIDQRPLSSSLIPKNSQSEFFGRDNDIKQIMDLLVSDEHGSSCGKDVSVISIMGMGGLGKTTLAQLVYNNKNVQNHFSVRAWVCVSDHFDILRITKEIIESATGGSCNSSSFDSMQRNLEEILIAKRFLIVLDDVWNTEHGAWERLRPPFSFGAKGSKIIVTTRDEVVSRIMDTNHFYSLNLLSDDDCLSLFLRHAFVGENYNAHPKLMEIGKDLVKSHCQGLPLAAKALGGLLSSKRDINFWMSILNSQLWSSNEGESEVMRALRLSYHHLPPHIKQCFSFCSIFPKDYEFHKNVLVNLWMAQGFIQPKHGIMLSTLEETGSTYFDFLLSRSFFQVEPWSENEFRYKMHDCIHDLAMLVSNDESFKFDGKPTCSPRRGHRHSSFIMVDDNDTSNLKDLYNRKGLRTVIIQNSNHLTNQILSILIVNSRCLRSLVLKKSDITVLPYSISNLKHLRYLDLSFSKIRQLPESVCSLYNLQTLDLLLCEQLCQLPKETRKLVNLRHLNLNGCWSLKSMPPEMGRLTCLQTLSIFIVGRGRGCGIGELKGLTPLKGSIEITELHNVSNAKEAKEANLKDKPNIDGLRLEWNDDKQNAANTNLQHDRVSLEELEKILEALQPHTNIKSLWIKGYGGKNLPSWLQSLTSLQELIIHCCPQLLSLPEGLPTSLQYLRILRSSKLSKRCRKKIGEDWAKISHIPKIVIDWRSIS